MITYLLILIFGAICFIAGLLLDKETGQKIKTKVEYISRPKKKIDVFEPDELALDKKEQQNI